MSNFKNFNFFSFRRSIKIKIYLFFGEILVKLIINPITNLLLTNKLNIFFLFNKVKIQE